MESNLQPSFIPKKPLNQPLMKPRGSVNLFSMLSTIVFVITLAAAGAAFGFQMYLNSQLTQRQTELNTKLSDFKPSLVDELSRFDSKIESAKKLLKNHFSVSTFFVALGNATLKTVRLSGFSFTANPGQDISMSVKGQAKSFMSLVLQQQEFSKPENQKYFKNPIFSDFALDKDGNVTFSLSTAINTAPFIFGKSQTADVPAAVDTITPPAI